MSYAATLQRVGAETDPEHSAVMFLTQLAGARARRFFRARGRAGRAGPRSRAPDGGGPSARARSKCVECHPLTPAARAQAAVTGDGARWRHLSTPGRRQLRKAPGPWRWRTPSLASSARGAKEARTRTSSARSRPPPCVRLLRGSSPAQPAPQTETVFSPRRCSLAAPALRAPSGWGARARTPALTGGWIAGLQIQRKARRKTQSDLVRHLDAMLPDSFRRGVSFNGAGGRALGMAGRSLHDVLEDAVMAVAWMRSAQSGSAPAQQTGGDAGASAKRGDLDVCDHGTRPKATERGAHGRPSPTYGALMREFMESSRKNLCDVSADANLFVLSTGLRDRGVRRKAPHKLLLDNKLLPDKRDSGSSAPSRQISPSTQRLCSPASPAEDSSTTQGADSWSAHATPSPPPEKMARERLALAPLVLDARQHPRLPPMHMVSGSDGGLMEAQATSAAQMSGVALSGGACKTTEQSQELLMQELLMQELSRVAATARLREQVLLLHLLQQSTARWPSLGKVDNDTQALAPLANLPQVHVPSDLLLRLPAQ